MAQEESISLIVDTLFYIFLILFAITISYIILIQLFPFEPQLDLQENVETAIQISEYLGSSPLTKAKYAFLSAELDKLNGKNEEFFVRHCTMAYRAEIESAGKKWEFGFKPNTGVLSARPGLTPFYGVSGRRLGFLNEYKLTSPVSVDEKPGTMTVTVYEDSLTHITCIVERAQKLKKKESMKCKVQDDDSRQVRCGLIIEKSGDDVCIRPPEFPKGSPVSECRNMKDLNLVFDYKEIKSEQAKEMILSAYPVKVAGAECGKITGNMIASENDNVAAVVLCIEEGME